MYRSLRRYYHNTKPLFDDAMDSIRTKSDIITLRSSRELASFDAWVEEIIESLIWRLDDLLTVSLQRSYTSSYLAQLTHLHRNCSIFHGIRY